jgi:hypothetical protein
VDGFALQLRTADFIFRFRNSIRIIDHAIKALYPYTQFHDLCHDMYIKVVGGDLTLEEEEVLKKLD